MRLDIIHATRYAYAPEVQTSWHVACLKPRGDATGQGQALLAHALAIEPPPAYRHDGEDAAGNARCIFAHEAPHAELTVLAHSRVATAASAPDHGAGSQAWERLRESLTYRAGGAHDPATDSLFASPYAPLGGPFAPFAAPCFTPGRPLAEAARALSSRIHAELRYETASTDVQTPAAAALEQRHGVCQDFAHILVACLRTLGIPARYVSGYLLTNPPPGMPRLIGADASHAWAAAYLGQDQWLHLDPTNDRAGLGTPGEDYAITAIGRDFGDVSPLRGMIQGGASHHPQVQVTVAPEGDAALADLKLLF